MKAVSDRYKKHNNNEQKSTFIILLRNMKTQERSET